MVVPCADLSGLLCFQLPHLFRLLSGLIRAETKFALLPDSPSIHSSIDINSCSKMRANINTHNIAEFDFFGWSQTLSEARILTPQIKITGISKTC